jgi:hypothetical protein
VQTSSGELEWRREGRDFVRLAQGGKIDFSVDVSAQTFVLFSFGEESCDEW